MAYKPAKTTLKRKVGDVFNKVVPGSKTIYQRDRLKDTILDSSRKMKVKTFRPPSYRNFNFGKGVGK